MTAAAFSGDGSVLAVAAEKVITLWDPERNILVATVGESLEVSSWHASINFTLLTYKKITISHFLVQI